MKKTTPFFITGLELVKLSELPPEEAEYINRNIPREKIISIKTDTEELGDCIYFCDYERFMAIFNINAFTQFFESQI